MKNEQILTKQQIVDMFNINRKTFEKWVERDGLPMVKIGPYKRYCRVSQLIDWLDSNTINLPQKDVTDKEFKWKPIWGKN